MKLARSTCLKALVQVGLVNQLAQHLSVECCLWEQEAEALQEAKGLLLV